MYVVIGKRIIKSAGIGVDILGHFDSWRSGQCVGIRRLSGSVMCQKKVILEDYEP
jgi:hypothetical protein